MSRQSLRWILPIAVVSILLGTVIAHFASANPDGLEKVAHRQDFAKNERPVASAPLPNYEVPWFKGPIGKTVVGLFGVVLVFLFVYGLGRLLALRPSAAPTDEDPTGATEHATPPGT